MAVSPIPPQFAGLVEMANGEEAILERGTFLPIQQEMIST